MKYLITQSGKEFACLPLEGSPDTIKAAGGARIFRGDTPPTAEQMSALFEPSYREKRAARYAAEASVFDLADAEAKLASPDLAVRAEGAAQKAAALAKRLQIKAEIPKPV